MKETLKEIVFVLFILAIVGAIGLSIYSSHRRENEFQRYKQCCEWACDVRK